MGSRICKDIQKDIKLLIRAITDLKENEENFKIYERIALSTIKHQQYFTVNTRATKKAINDINSKLLVYGKYKEAKKFRQLVDFFLISFDFDNHPQSDLQWSLLTLLLELSAEIHNSDLSNLKSSQREFDSVVSIDNQIDPVQEIDWASYLKEEKGTFFHDYKSDEESEWSDSTNEDITDLACLPTETIVRDAYKETHENIIYNKETTLHNITSALKKHTEARQWLLSNIQNAWWNELEYYNYPIHSSCIEAHLCKRWFEASCGASCNVTTLSEYQICRELLWMFHAQVRTAVFMQKENEIFYIRPNISVPSLTTTAFHNILLPYCDLFSAMKELQQFECLLYEDLMTQSANRKPPLTYEAYNAAVRNHLLKFRRDIMKVEKDVLQQDNCHTLLSVSAFLRKPIYGIRMLYEVHKSCILNWRIHSNWKCASRLLSGLLAIIQASHCQEKTNICIDLFLFSISTYLNIIDTWLGEGRLEDWRDEFIITRISEETPTKSKRSSVRFVARKLDDICFKDSVMQFLMHKVLHMGHNIELLVSLNRITEMWSENIEHDRRTSLKDEFHTNFLSEISKYGIVNLPKDVEEEEAAETQVSTLHRDEDMEKNITMQLSSLSNPFLMKVFKNYLPPITCKQKVKEINTRIMKQTGSVLERLSSNDVQYALPLTKLLKKSLSEILDSRYDSASKLVKSIMLEEYKLQSHLKLMRSVYMMEAGHIMIKFYQILFYEIESNQTWNNSYFLSCILEEVLSQQWADSSAHWSIMVDETSTQQVLQAVNSITVHYAAGWPINIVLDEYALSKYNEIFRFQLKLKWALWTLNNLKFADLEGSRNTLFIGNVTANDLEYFHVRRLESLRFWLLHAIGSIHAYLSGQVLQGLGIMLDESLTQADSLDVIISIHKEYLDKVYKHCLLTTEFEDLMSTVYNLIEMCIHVRDRWEHKTEASEAELDLMENSYVKYHTYLALTLHNAVQYKDASYWQFIPRYRIRTLIGGVRNDEFKEIDMARKFVSELSRNLLTEIAHQMYPPSGVPLPIPKMVHQKDWKDIGQKPSLSDGKLTEYEQAFSYMRWYLHEAEPEVDSSVRINF